MSTTAGVFSETTLQDIRVKMAQMLLDSRVSKQFIPQADALKTLAKATTAKMTPLSNSEKDYDVELEWINACTEGVEDFVACELGGNKASTNTRKYTLQYDKQYGFTIDEADFTKNDFNFVDVMAKQMLKADVEHQQAFAQYFITVLNANAGVNDWTAGQYTCGDGSTYIPATNWTANLMAYIMQMSKMNRISNPILLDDGLLYQAWLLANFNASNDNGKGAQALFQGMNIDFDLVNPPAVNGDILTDYLIEIGAVSWANKVYHPAGSNSMQFFNIDGMIKFSQASKFTDILPLNYDVVIKGACSDNNLTKFDVNVRLKADIFVNPTGCNETNTGILTLNCGTCP